MCPNYSRNEPIVYATHRSPFVWAAHPHWHCVCPIAGGAAEPVAGGKPVSIVQNISDDLLDG
jgi:hypothetical protein|eukprot:2921576-Prymnesium_polylepis.1